MGPYKFISELIDSEMHCAEGPSANLLLDYILVDPVFGGAIILTCGILRSSIQRFLLERISK